jgi:hypothetical protein
VMRAISCCWISVIVSTPQKCFVSRLDSFNYIVNDSIIAIEKSRISKKDFPTSFGDGLQVCEKSQIETSRNQ